jgi:hypothetical protein
MRPRISATANPVQRPERNLRWAIGVHLKWLGPYLGEWDRTFLLRITQQGYEPSLSQLDQVIRIGLKAIRRMPRDGRRDETS